MDLKNTQNQLINSISYSLNIMDVKNTLRSYENDTPQYQLYRDMHRNQTYDYVKGMKEKYGKCQKTQMTITKAFSLLDNFIDPSDPDLDVPNTIHAYQTAERIRKKYPNDKEFQIIGLIHDVGKVLFSFGEPSWAVVGDTYVLGCDFPKSIVYYDTLKESPEYRKYDMFGLYKSKCGLDNLMISYGHDEYLYNVLKKNKNHLLSQKYLDVIRYHSLYPWHTNGDYKHLTNKKDEWVLENVVEFNTFDLYSKEDNTLIDIHVKSYYYDILNEYFFGELCW